MKKERKKKYNPGDRLGPKNILLLERTKRVGNTYYGIFQCPSCPKTWEVAIQSIVSGNTQSCGCQMRIREKGKHQKYHAGDQIGPYNIVLQKRIGQSRGIFQCPYDSNTFECEITSVVSGATRSCGCQAYSQSRNNGRKRMINLTGQKFNHLEVLKESLYRNGGNHVLWECQCDCGNPNLVYVRTSDLLKERIISCGCSKESRGELKIKAILSNKGIDFIAQKTFDGCKYKAKLKFDFYLPDYNCCIEYDGEQHFKESTLCSDTLEERQYRDRIKNQYCKDNNIKLIRIQYTDYDKLNEEYLMELLYGISS